MTSSDNQEEEEEEEEVEENLGELANGESIEPKLFRFRKERAPKQLAAVEQRRAPPNTPSTPSTTRTSTLTHLHNGRGRRGIAIPQHHHCQRVDKPEARVQQRALRVAAEHAEREVEVVGGEPAAALQHTRVRRRQVPPPPVQELGLVIHDNLAISSHLVPRRAPGKGLSCNYTISLGAARFTFFYVRMRGLIEL